ncbi:DNA-binding transcriptional regulator [Bacteroides sp. OttesenSCG-928-J23]|nr:DNA-binding transcriptional regulator [Bacteroides sp. OttesenSCG-928-J23]
MIRLILLTDFTEGFAHYLLKGILAYSKDREPWVVCKMPPSYKQRFGISGVLEWAQKWKADAIIAQFDDFDRVELFKENGMVAIAQDFKSRFSTIPNITGAYYQTGKVAADYFLEKGFKNFAFYGYKDVVWSAERCEGFKEQITKKGFGQNFQDYQHQELDDLWFYEIDSLCQWLVSLPKPVALMACDDNQGNRITEACKICNIRIPEEVAVLGVDNDELTCNLSDPSLSSVAMDIETAGSETAGLIEKMLHNPQNPYRDVVIQPKRIISRESTNIYATGDIYILNALRFIHQHIDSKLNVNDIVKVVPLSRRLLEMRFKEATGQSVYKYIFNLRMELLAQALIDTNDPITDIAVAVGLSDCRNLSRQFRSIKGCTPLEYRRRNG